MYSLEHISCGKARFYSDRIISLPLHLRLTNEDIFRAKNKLKEFVTANE